MTAASFAALCRQVVTLHRADPDDPRWQWTRTKLGHHALLTRIGAPHAIVHAVVAADELTADHLRQPRVVKPDGCSAGMGVMVLHPTPSGRVWHEARTGLSLPLTAVQARMRRVLAAYPERRYPDRWLVEERLTPPPRGTPRPAAPVDEYKVFCFGGSAALVMVHRAGRGRTVKQWFVPGGWGATYCGRRGDVIDATLPPPPAPLRRPLLALAGRVADETAQLNRLTFTRVDVFNTARGLVVGEVNDHDGNPTFTAGWDSRLGHAWAQAGGVR